MELRHSCGLRSKEDCAVVIRRADLKSVSRGLLGTRCKFTLIAVRGGLESVLKRAGYFSTRYEGSLRVIWAVYVGKAAIDGLIPRKNLSAALKGLGKPTRNEAVLRWGLFAT